jgi:Uma2 family endonuclease
MTVYEYWLYDKNREYIETIYMTEEEFNEYMGSHMTALTYKKQVASEGFQL